MRKLIARWLPCLFTLEQKHTRLRYPNPLEVRRMWRRRWERKEKEKQWLILRLGNWCQLLSGIAMALSKSITFGKARQGQNRKKLCIITWQAKRKNCGKRTNFLSPRLPAYIWAFVIFKTNIFYFWLQMKLVDYPSYSPYLAPSNVFVI